MICPKCMDERYRKDPKEVVMILGPKDRHGIQNYVCPECGFVVSKKS